MEDACHLAVVAPCLPFVAVTNMVAYPVSSALAAYREQDNVHHHASSAVAAFHFAWAASVRCGVFREAVACPSSWEAYYWLLSVEVIQLKEAPSSEAFPLVDAYQDQALHKGDHFNSILAAWATYDDIPWAPHSDAADIHESTAASFSLDHPNSSSPTNLFHTLFTSPRTL